MTSSSCASCASSCGARRRVALRRRIGFAADASGDVDERAARRAELAADDERGRHADGAGREEHDATGCRGRGSR